MSKNPELDARCDYAIFKVIGLEKSAERAKALSVAKTCGYKAYPDTRVSAFFIDEPELLVAYQTGWGAHAYHDRPKTDEDLEAAITEMDNAANAGCGLFYELYEQSFTQSVSSWLPSLREEERLRALELLKKTVYAPEVRGTWSYDVEENDITYSEGD